MSSASALSFSHYFAYGSNLNKTQMESRLGKNEFVDIAYLSNYIFKFNKQSKIPNQGYANIEPQENETVYGVVYRITVEQLNQMDRYEGFLSEGNPNNHYDRQEVNVTLLTRMTTLKVIVYVASNKFRIIANNLFPSDTYLTTIIVGANEVRLPQAYIDHIKAKALGNNPKLLTTAEKAEKADTKEIKE